MTFLRDLDESRPALLRIFLNESLPKSHCNSLVTASARSNTSNESPTVPSTRAAFDIPR